MQAFSRGLIDIYQAAEQTPVDRFSDEILRIANTLFKFDGAVLGAGEAPVEADAQLDVDESFVFERDKSILCDYAEVAGADPVARQFLGGLRLPLAVDCKNLYRPQSFNQLAHFSARHELTHLLLFGDMPSLRSGVKWLVLYRSTDKPFNQSDSDYLQALWPHLSRAVALNRSRQIDRTLGVIADRAAALLNQSGFFEVADPHFRELLRLEWSDCSTSRIPALLLQALKANRAYTGRHVQISAQAMQGHLLCSIVRKSRFHLLSPTELAISNRYAIGLSHKEIARLTGLSHHTVRSHIAHTYDKLGINNKAQLATLFASNRAAPSI